MKINHKLHLDLASPGLPPRLQVTQDDSVSHVLQLHLKENGKAWPIPADTTVLVHFRKSDRTGGVYDTLPDGSAAWQIQGNALLVTLAPQVLSAPGETALAVTLIQGDSRLTVARIVLQVAACPGFAGVSESYSYVSAFVPQPADPKVGQMLQIKEVGSNGVILATESVSSGLDAAVTLLLSLLQKAMYAEDVSDTLVALEEQLVGGAPAVTIVSIDAVYAGTAVYAGSDPASLQHVTVTVHYSDGTEQQVKNFRLSGVINEGENTITVSYGSYTDTITVIGIARPVDQYYVYNNLSYATNSNSATTVAPGGSYSCIITAHSGYALKRLLVTMGGEVMMEENYTTAPLESGWSTDNVTGDIIITALAEQTVALSHLTVTYTGGSVPEGTKLSALTGISVTAHYTDGTQELLNGGYSLSGTIGVGSNTVTVNYGGCTATFTVTGTAVPATYVLTHSWDLTTSLTDSIGGAVAQTDAAMDTSGLHFTENDQYLQLLPEQESILCKAVEIDISAGMLTSPTTQHGRLFAVSTDEYWSCASAACFTWRYNNSIGWASYIGNTTDSNWDISLDSTAYPLDFFNGKTVRLACDDRGYVTLSYATIGSSEFTTVHTWSKPWTITTGYFVIGGDLNNELSPITFSAVRIYEEE